MTVDHSFSPDKGRYGNHEEFFIAYNKPMNLLRFDRKYGNFHYQVVKTDIDYIVHYKHSRSVVRYPVNQLIKTDGAMPFDMRFLGLAPWIAIEDCMEWDKYTEYFYKCDITSIEKINGMYALTLEQNMLPVGSGRVREILTIDISKDINIPCVVEYRQYVSAETRQARNWKPTAKITTEWGEMYNRPVPVKIEAFDLINNNSRNVVINWQTADVDKKSELFSIQSMSLLPSTVIANEFLPGKLVTEEIYFPKEQPLAPNYILRYTLIAISAISVLAVVVLQFRKRFG